MKPVEEFLNLYNNIDSLKNNEINELYIATNDLYYDVCKTDDMKKIYEKIFKNYDPKTIYTIINNPTLQNYKNRPEMINAKKLFFISYCVLLFFKNSYNMKKEEFHEYLIKLMNRFDLDEKSKLRKAIEKEICVEQKSTISDNGYDNNILEDYINIVKIIDNNTNINLLILHDKSKELQTQVLSTKKLKTITTNIMSKILNLCTLYNNNTKLVNKLFEEFNIYYLKKDDNNNTFIKYYHNFIVNYDLYFTEEYNDNYENIKKNIFFNLNELSKLNENFKNIFIKLYNKLLNEIKDI